MNGTLRTRLACAVAATTIGLAGTATQSVAADPAPSPDATIDFPAGQACPGFDLRVEIWNNEHRVFKEFRDKNGNVVRMLSAGKGSTLAFTNLATREKFSLKPNGAVEHTTINPDGSQTVAVTGHNVLILFPTDVPAGPSTTLHVGRVVYTVSAASGVFTLQSVSGKSSNICDALL
jgi:hypothetical protein